LAILKERSDLAIQLRQEITENLSSSSSMSSATIATGELDIDPIPAPPASDVVGSAMTSSFLDWLTATGKAQKIIDLIKLDGGDKRGKQVDSMFS
jgi:hypothetical protein